MTTARPRPTRNLDRKSEEPKLILRRAVSKHKPVFDEQARYPAVLMGELIDETRLSADPEGSEPETPQFVELPSYLHLIRGSYACGFVCGDMTPDFPLAQANARPQEVLADIGFPALRHYIHTLLRAERHSDGFGSHVQEAVKSGALALVQRRLMSDDRLYERL